MYIHVYVFNYLKLMEMVETTVENADIFDTWEGVYPFSKNCNFLK